MGAYDSATLAALKRHRETLFDPPVAAHNGRIVKLIGDGTLVEFASVIDAVNCSLAIQRGVQRQTKSDNAITLRFGVNLGDFLIDGDDIHGDGANLAARLEPLAIQGSDLWRAFLASALGHVGQIAEAQSIRQFGLKADKAKFQHVTGLAHSHRFRRR